MGKTNNALGIQDVYYYYKLHQVLVVAGIRFRAADFISDAKLMK